jgi:hypothetical protein
MDPAEAELARRRAAVAAGTTDLVRWMDETQYDAGWQSRAGRAVELAKDSRWFCDIGCGPQFLRGLLPAGSVYLPADLRRWTPDTAEIELNAGRLPVTYLELSDTCFLLGVLEYLLNVQGFLRALSPRVDRVVFSYNPIELVPDDRAAMGWLNAMTTPELTEAFRRSGLQLEHLEPCGTTQVLGCARGRRSALARAILPLRRARFLRAQAPQPTS